MNGEGKKKKKGRKKEGRHGGGAYWECTPPPRDQRDPVDRSQKLPSNCSPAAAAPACRRQVSLKRNVGLTPARMPTALGRFLFSRLYSSVFSSSIIPSWETWLGSLFSFCSLWRFLRAAALRVCLICLFVQVSPVTLVFSLSVCMRSMCKHTHNFIILLVAIIFNRCYC